MDRGQEAYIFRNKMAAKETLSAHTIVLQNPRPFLIFLVQGLEKLKDDPGKEVGKLQPNYYWWINRSATTQIILRLTGCPHRFQNQGVTSCIHTALQHAVDKQHDALPPGHYNMAS